MPGSARKSLGIIPARPSPHTNPKRDQPAMSALTRRSALSAISCAMASSALGADQPPNVLLVISDQLYHRALGCAGNQVIRTPNIDRLARQGVRFENALCPTPFCSPTRASLMTGLFPHQHGVIRNLRNDNPGLDPDLPTTEQSLMEAGYVAKQFGKWHLGEKTRVPAYAHDPEQNYRQHFRSIGRAMPAPPDGPLNRVGRPIFSIEAVKAANAKYGGKGATNGWIGRTDVPLEHTEEAWIADRAIEALRDLAGQSFFMTVSFPAPHALWAINEPYYSLYERTRIPLPANRGSVQDVDRGSVGWRFGQLLGDDGLREYLGVYYGMVSMMDANLGRILDELDRLEQTRDTLVVFTSDHGDMQGGHGMYGKTSYTMYEETTRVPLVLRYPGRIPAGMTIQTQAGSCDIAPTILDYLGRGVPAGLSGRSLRTFIEGGEDLERPMFAERDRSAWDAGGHPNFQRLIRTREWKYSYNSRADSQLFDLANDPGETSNLIHDPAARNVKLRLHGQLIGWMNQTGDPRSGEMGDA